MHPRIKRKPQTFRRDEVRVVTFNIIPLYFTFTDFEAEAEEFQLIHELHIMKCSAAQESKRGNDLDCSQNVLKLLP